jgi:hypothetical protein
VSHRCSSALVLLFLFLLLLLLLLCATATPSPDVGAWMSGGRLTPSNSSPSRRSYIACTLPTWLLVGFPERTQSINVEIRESQC